ncbi:MAG: universal stress protein, partial [Nitrosopumilus sp.]|nr:universal stress protein [Nitrosopumilus sp.]
EKLHEEVIDSGLAKIYQSHLDVSRDVAQDEGADIKTTLLDGKAFEKVIQYVRKEQPWLLIVGRIGVHSDDDMDIGSNAENLLRSAPCNVLISNRKFVPPIDTQAEYTIAWTEEALRRMEKIPVFARGVAKTAIHRYAIEKGHTIISNSVIDDAVGDILPAGAMDAMKNLGGTLDAAGVDRNAMQADNQVAQDLMGSTMSGMMSQVVEEKPAAANPLSAGNQNYLDRMSRDYYVCGGCGYIGKGAHPVLCPVCGLDGAQFKQVDKSIFDAAAQAEGGLETEVAYDDIPMQWTKDAREAIRAVPAGFQRRRAKAKIEKTARKLGMTTITLEYAAPMIQEAAAEDYTPIFANKTAGEVSTMGSDSKNDEKSEKNGVDPYTWEPDALQRLERAPAGFMRDCTKALIIKHAEKMGTTTITLDVANQGIEQAKETMEDAMKTGNVKDIVAKLTGTGSPSEAQSGAGNNG